MSLTSGKRRRPECPAAATQLDAVMHPRVLSQVPHDHRAVRSSRKQQEGPDGAQAAARDLETHSKLCSPTLPYGPSPRSLGCGRWTCLSDSVLQRRAGLTARPCSVCVARMAKPPSVIPFTTYIAKHCYFQAPKTDTHKSHCSPQFW